MPESPSEIEKSVICRLLEGIYDGSQLVRCETVRTLYRAAASNSTWISREMSIKVRQQIMNDQIEGGMCKSAPILRQMNSSSAQDLHCKLSAPDESHKKAHSVDEGNAFSTTGKFQPTKEKCDVFKTRLNQDDLFLSLCR